MTLCLPVIQSKCIFRVDDISNPGSVAGMPGNGIPAETVLYVCMNQL
jgi:hypothetical protein